MLLFKSIVCDIVKKIFEVCFKLLVIFKVVLIGKNGKDNIRVYCIICFKLLFKI